MKRALLASIGMVLFLGANLQQANAQAYSESFNDITLLAGNGWSMQNLSSPVGSTNWFQGTAVSGGGPFDAYNGAANAYIGGNYNNTGNTGTISNWLMTPNRTLRNGDVFTFYTRKASPDMYADRLEVRLSTNGASTDAGTNATTVGDFSTVLLTINPTLVLNVYPIVWTQYTITISGLPAPTSGRIAFRYFVTGAGLSGTNSDYIGIDQVDYTPYVCLAMTVSPSTLPGGTAGSAYSQSLGQTGALGAPSYAITAGALPPGITLSAGGTISGTPTATGTFNFTVTVSDASGCTGSQAYSITTTCPINGASLSSFPALCSNGTPYTLVEGSPAGGTYSGSGVSGGQFDPASGTQTITYTLIDPYGCTQTTNNTFTVNTAPTVTLSTFSAACSNAGAVTLSGGSPAGGTYSGTGVSGSQFDPSGGTQNITYTYTDANGCSNSDMQSFPVNTAPTVTLSTFSAVCDNGGTVNLSGGSPAGGVYSGTGVSGSQFDPSSGSQTITYTYTDANGCTNSDAQTQTVNTAPTVSLSSFSPACSYDGTVTLSGGSPAGGTYAGTGVSGGMFDPSAGTQTITYTYTDANGCTNDDAQTLTVNVQPTVGLSAGSNTVCLTGGTVLLNGSPSGGTYFGSAVSGNTFSPSTAGVGAHVVSYTYTDVTTGCADTATTSITVNACAGIENNDLNNMVQLFPNPADEVVSLNIVAGIQTGSWLLEIYTIDGKMIYKKELLVNSTSYTETFNVAEFAPGTYIAKVYNGKGGSAVKRFIKK